MPEVTETTEVKERSYKRYNITPEQFVTVWAASATLDEVVAGTGMGESAVQSRAAAYRRQGVQLKKFPRRNKPKIDVEKLNEIVSA